MEHTDGDYIFATHRALNALLDSMDIKDEKVRKHYKKIFAQTMGESLGMIIIKRAGKEASHE